MSDGRRGRKQAARERRSAEALRANLKRRKAQERSRDEAKPEPNGPSQAKPDDEGKPGQA